MTIPKISTHDGFDILVRKLAAYFVDVIDAPHDFEELKKVVYGRCLKPLVKCLVDDVHHEALVCGLLALKWHFTEIEDEDDRGINDTRGLACELVAWRFVSHLTYREAIDHLCYELPPAKSGAPPDDGDEEQTPNGNVMVSSSDESTPLLDGADNSLDIESRETTSDVDIQAEPFAATFAGLNALEIAAVSGCKTFLGQKAVQRIVDGIWKGDIVFWDSMSTHSTKQARIYNRSRSDPYCRLRVPLYLRIFEALFFATFLALYYTVLLKEPSNRFTGAEVFLYIWLVAFSYNELGEYFDAGGTLYATDFWSMWDLGIIAVGTAFFVVRIVGITENNLKTSKIAFDILSVEALLLVPRACSLLSLHPYFGMLLPALKEMTKDFIKFTGLVAILYMGFDTTFSSLARETYSFGKMNWILVKVFFGSGYLGFDIAEDISPILGPPLMFIFVCLTNVLLITSLISLLSNSLTKVLEHSRAEYLFMYSVYVLEASTSNRLTYFLPPLNLIPLLLRPLRLALDAETLRPLRIVLLKATHWPFVAMILGYERWRLHLYQRRSRMSHLVRGPNFPNGMRRPLSLSGKQTYKPLLATNSQLADEAMTARAASTGMSSAALDTKDGLEVALANLRAQIETISSIIAKRNEMSNAPA